MERETILTGAQRRTADYPTVPGEEHATGTGAGQASVAGVEQTTGAGAGDTTDLGAGPATVAGAGQTTGAGTDGAAAGDDPDHEAWQGQTDGRPWMLRSLIAIFRRVDVRLLYGVMAMVVLFYMVGNRNGYRAMRDFFRRRMGYGRWRTLRAVYANHFRFGQVILDRFAVYAGRRFRIEIEHNEYYRELVTRPEGFLLVSSHVGNYELAGYSLHPEEKRLYALVFAGEKETVMQNRARCFAGNNIEMVPVRRDMSHLFVANRALLDGNIVGMPGDRLFGSQKYVCCDFLGAPARFPLGPFALGVQRDVKMLSIFVMKESAKQYRIFVERIDSGDAAMPKKLRMEMAARSFSTQLERIVRRYPTQWFNYYNFWE